MTTGSTALRTLVMYGLCVPLALMVGYLLAQPLDWSTIIFFAVMLVILITPLLLRWHHLLLLATVNSPAVALFIPGHAQLWQVVAVVSLTISILQLTLSRRLRFIYAPTISRPLFFLLAVFLLTAKVTGGIGFHVLGGESIGGKRYLNLFAAIIAYFAITARRIPPNKAFLYTGLFFLGGAATILSSLANFVGPGLSFIFWIIPPEAIPGQGASEASGAILRLGGLAFGALAVISILLSRYGMRGILFSGKPWRPIALATCILISLFGGFRVVLIVILLYLAIQGYLEDVFKSKWMPVLALALVFMATVSLPFTSRLPLPFQRALSVLPVDVVPEARDAARDSSEWRLAIWRDVLPQVPQYLLLGKGYAMNAQEWYQANSSFSTGAAGTVMAGDYHSGPLSTVIPFGIWGAIGLAWLLWAGGRLLYNNYRFGDPQIKTINTFLFSAYLCQVIIFLFVFGGFHSDMIRFTSMLGLSIALNGGMCRPARALVPQPVNLRIRVPIRPAPGFSR